MQNTVVVSIRSCLSNNRVLQRLELSCGLQTSSSRRLGPSVSVHLRLGPLSALQDFQHLLPQYYKKVALCISLQTVINTFFSASYLATKASKRAVRCQMLSCKSALVTMAENQETQRIEVPDSGRHKTVAPAQPALSRQLPLRFQ